MYPGAMPSLPSAWDAERRKQIDRTKTGILLLLVGTLIGWLPLIGVIGFILILVGAILVILGRKAFGPAHARKVVISIALFFVGIIIFIVAGIIFASALIVGFLGGTPNQAAVQSALNNYLIVAFIATICLGLVSVLFTYELQNQTGRLLLFAGYAATVVIQIAIYVIVSQTIASAIAAMFPGGTYNPAQATVAIANFSARSQSLALLGGIPALLYTGANYIAWNRINKGEIPASTAPPPMAPAPMPPR
jgi:MFS family permease